MKKQTIIKVNSDVKYLSEVMNDLPANCIFDKGKVGAGGTTIALKSNDNFIIAVPFKNLIINKVNQFPNGEILGVDGNTNKKDIFEYMSSHNIKKIMVTYDSLEKLTNWINPKEFNILIDEYHILFQSYSFRRDAARSVLNNYEKYKTFTFMSATMLEDDFILDELINIPVVKCEWEDIKEVEVKSIKCKNNVSSTTSQIINDFVNGSFEGKAFFFVNSVEFIKEMIEVCNLDNNNCRVIYSKNNKTKLNIENSDTLSEPKIINFLTSTCFEGCDLFCEDAHIFVISDNRKQHTLLDISTSLQQIAGRIRDTKYWNVIYHLFTNTRYDIEITYDEFKDVCNEQIEVNKSIVNKFNTLFTEKEKEMGLSKFNDEALYIYKEGNIFKFDPNRVKLDLYNFKITKCVYRLRVNMKKEYNKAGFIVSDYNNNTLAIKKVEDIELKFPDLVKNLEENKFELGLEELIYEKYPFLREAIKKLGFERIKELKYSITKIKEELLKLKGVSLEIKIFTLLKANNKLSSGVFVSSADLKNIFNKVYNTLDIKKCAKGTDILDYYEVKETKHKINGKSTRGYVIIKPKIVVK